MEWPLGSNSRARSSGLRPARTRSTICRRNSGEYGGRVLGIGNTSGERLRVSTTKPGQSRPEALDDSSPREGRVQQSCLGEFGRFLADDGGGGGIAATLAKPEK